jgi:hypothetical protein
VVARLWGQESNSRHGPRPRLDLAGIVAAALRRADRDGLEDVRMNGIAAEVGMATMSLYRHVLGLLLPGVETLIAGKA